MSSRADKFVLAAVEEGAYSFDIEHEKNLDVMSEGFKLHGCSFATKGFVFYSTDMSEVSDICSRLFPKDIYAIAHNGKYDIKCLKRAGVIHAYPFKLADTMVAMNLLNDNLRPNQLGLKSLILRIFNHKMHSFDEGSRFGLAHERFHRYACDDARQEFKLWNYVKPKLEKEKLLKLFDKVLMRVLKVFADMELTGIKWDLAQSRDLLYGFSRLKEDTEDEIFADIGKLNLNSGKQLAVRLFDELGYDPGRIPWLEKSGRYSVDASSMDILARKYPVCAKVKLFRTASKMLSTYMEPLTTLALKTKNKRIYPTFWIVSSTGRTRSDKPNFQNIPAHLADTFSHLNIRSCITAEKGRKLVVCDLSQIELRLIAHITRDPLFVSAYTNWTCKSCGEAGKDSSILHACPKCGVPENEEILVDEEAEGFWHGLDLHQITTDNIPALKGNRQDGKTTNFAVSYNVTAARMHYAYPALTKSQWKAVIFQFFKTYRGLKIWHERMRRKLFEDGVAVDIFGRKRRIPRRDIESSAKHALNMLINFGPQASACGIFELAMVEMYDKWVTSGEWMRDVFMTNMVHDELVLEVSENKLDEVIPVVVDCMENSTQLRVPIRTDIIVCDRWSEAK